MRTIRKRQVKKRKRANGKRNWNGTPTIKRVRVNKNHWVRVGMMTSGIQRANFKYIAICSRKMIRGWTKLIIVSSWIGKKKIVRKWIWEKKAGISQWRIKTCRTSKRRNNVKNVGLRRRMILWSNTIKFLKISTESIWGRRKRFSVR
jgi:hypothetical protein